MRKAIVLMMAFVLAVSSLYGSDRKRRRNLRLFPHRIDCLDNVDIDIDDGSVIISPEYGDDEYVEITEEYKLYVNGRKVRTSTEEREMLAAYHEQVYDIVDEAKRIGWKGAKIGVQGAKLGVKAIAGVFKLILPGYGTDDLERDMEREAEKIEEKAELLEQEAEVIEEMADDLEDMHYQLRRQIPELDRLAWF